MTTIDRKVSIALLKRVVLLVDGFGFAAFGCYGNRRVFCRVGLIVRRVCMSASCIRKLIRTALAADGFKHGCPRPLAGKQDFGRSRRMNGAAWFTASFDCGWQRGLVDLCQVFFMLQAGCKGGN